MLNSNIGTAIDRPSKGWLSIRLLTANLGNLDLRHQRHYNNKLCDKKTENVIASNIRALQPDVVFLQELLHPDQCKGWVEINPNNVCYKFEEQKEKYQPRRLLGANYSIACAARNSLKLGHPVSLECIAVNTGVGLIEGCEAGGLCFGIGVQDTIKPGCNPDFVIHSVKARIRGLAVKLINVHVESRNRKCRNVAIRQIFERGDSYGGLAFEEYTIVAGDFNFDPFRDKDDLQDFWNIYVGDDNAKSPFRYHSGPVEHQPPYPTVRFLLQHRTVDHILSNFAVGASLTLGEAPGTLRLDNGLGMDHRALLCDLWIPPN